ncbi:hypothetical protein GCM10011512_26500 [Tersicoccus solisilvae]|uniref:Uncharacterized protein n=1 Tax=Tersicoccus solisilvae TaxID=1882339 RepID=A0ABQ1PJD0_9MICC|nr:hypothetical protein [Tersicoccus solisilvae]GGC98240.1 hypothetical protein GCM10011512_26500 [Tersicoccus solisilvae]
MTTDDGARLKADLHRIFDRQISTFGSYNLLYGYGSAEYPPPRAGIAPGTRRDFIVGYCMTPVEVVFAPFLLPALTPVEPATAVNATNLAFAEIGTDSWYEVETNIGVRFGVTVRGRARLAVDGSTTWLDQGDDADDFARFMAEEFVDL